MHLVRKVSYNFKILPTSCGASEHEKISFNIAYFVCYFQLRIVMLYK